MEAAPLLSLNIILHIYFFLYQWSTEGHWFIQSTGVSLFCFFLNISSTPLSKIFEARNSSRLSLLTLDAGLCKRVWLMKISGYSRGKQNFIDWKSSQTAHKQRTPFAFKYKDTLILGVLALSFPFLDQKIKVKYVKGSKISIPNLTNLSPRRSGMGRGNNKL